jgi:transcriptional regulator with XRE-family HTH domain
VKRRKIIGQNVYRLRMKVGMTQTQLADFADLSTRYIQKIEHGEANITVEVVEKLVAIFKCHLTDIVGQIGQPESTSSFGKERASSAQR